MRYTWKCCTIKILQGLLKMYCPYKNCTFYFSSPVCYWTSHVTIQQGHLTTAKTCWCIVNTFSELLSSAIISGIFPDIVLYHCFHSSQNIYKGCSKISLNGLEFLVKNLLIEKEQQGFQSGWILFNL